MDVPGSCTLSMIWSHPVVVKLPDHPNPSQRVTTSPVKIPVRCRVPHPRERASSKRGLRQGLLLTRCFWMAGVLLIALRAFADTTPVCNVKNYGAKGDGVTLDTGPISAAIAA